MTQDKKTVFVGLSGGVDSSVAALRLTRAGHNVVGVFIKVWQPDFLTCNWEEERLDAMRVAATLGIPFHTFDAVDIYKKEVADYMVSEYKAGRTPNPDTMCNQHVKFGAFLNHARSEGADYVATGHYAQVREVAGEYQLHKGADQEKDQSYFLWTLTKEELRHTLFPIGDSKKETVRKEAKRAGLLTAAKKDSQGVCFLGQLDMEAFLGHYIEKKEGDVVDEKGAVVGTHDGVWFFTIGQRHGFTHTTQADNQVPYYVERKDVERNILYVSSTQPVYKEPVLTLTNVRSSGTLRENQEVEIVSRYREQPRKCVIQKSTATTLRVQVKDTLTAPTEGQSCVLYDGTQCLGGGIIDDIDHA